MADQHNPATTPTHGSGASFADRIELGGTVNDALGVPIGLVHDVDRDRNYLTIDGRPAGFGQYEVPLSTVERVGENDVHLNMVMDTTASSPGSTIRLVPKSQHAQTTHRTPPATPTSTTPTQRVHTAVHVPVDLNQDKSSRGTGMALAGVAAGLAAAGAGYWWWRRTRRKSAMDRTIDFLTSRTPTWWGAAAASTLPVLMPLAVAYARSGRDSTADRVRDRLDAWTPTTRSRSSDARKQVERWMAAAPAFSVAELVGAASDRLPSASNLPGADYLPGFNRSSAFDWLPSFDRDSLPPARSFGVPIAALAVALLALFVAGRRSRQSTHTLRVADVMTHRPQVIRPDASVAEAAALMRSLNIGALPVSDSGRLMGMLTDRDIAIRVVADGRDPHLTQVKDVMSPDTTWTREDDPVDEAARIMREHQVRRLPVVDERHNLVGIVSLGDIATDVGDDRLSGETLEDVSEPSRPKR